MKFHILAPLCTAVGIAIGMPIQIWRLYKSKTANEISLVNFLITICANICYMFYASEINNIFLVRVNIVSLFLNLIVIGQILNYRFFYKKERRPS